jgi:hypothetical protein
MDRHIRGAILHKHPEIEINICEVRACVRAYSYLRSGYMKLHTE